MLRKKGIRTSLVIVAFLLAGISTALAQRQFTMEQIFSEPYPSEVISAQSVDRIAWLSYDQGLRNIYTAGAPDFKPVRLTSYLQDDGQALSDLRISDDGSVIVYVRGGNANSDGWFPNPMSRPDGTEQAIWAVKTTGGKPWKLALANNPVLSPDGKWVLYVRDKQIYQAAVGRSGEIFESRSEIKPLFISQGKNGSPRWAPDSKKIAFVSNREDHAYIGVYNCETRKITWMAPGVDKDISPVWSPDGKKIAFFRRGGSAFSAPAWFKEGHGVEIWIADAATGKGQRHWHPPTKSPWHFSFGSLTWTKNNYLLFKAEPDNWKHYFSVPAAGGKAVDLTPAESFVEHIAFSCDGKYLFYSTNEGDVDRRHIWKVPTKGGKAVQLTKGSGIETHPAALASGNKLACLSATFNRPQSVTLVSLPGGTARIIAPQLPDDFPMSELVEPQQVIIKAPDGWDIHCQLFVPKGAKPGDGRAAVLFMHGGPSRQMLLGWHYRHYYANTYGFNQYLANKGYVVLSVNYRRGIGYGRKFRLAKKSGSRGAKEYEDVLAAGKYLQNRCEVDPNRVGLWGGSYGGYLTAIGLAKNSDVFAAGVDLNGVHLRGTSTDPDNIAYQSSPIAYIDTWRSPVFLSHGDDDRNVAFSQTTGLVQLLRRKGVHYELLIFPDEVHSYLIHKNLLKFYNMSADFFDRFLKSKK